MKGVIDPNKFCSELIWNMEIIEKNDDEIQEPFGWNCPSSVRSDSVKTITSFNSW